MVFRRNIHTYINLPLTHQIVSDALVDYNRPNDKISELVKSGILIPLRRGLYIPGPEADLPVPHLFTIANHLRGPSYISLETALSYWGIIPEQVHEIISMTLKSPRVYDTPIGRFTYHHLKAPYYSFGLERIEVGTGQFVLIASKEKAICDKIIATSGVNLRSRLQTLDFLIEDMRMDEDMLANLNPDTIEDWIEDAPKRTSLQMLVKTIRML